jgi:hypothetical protein
MKSTTLHWNQNLYCKVERKVLERLEGVPWFPHNWSTKLGAPSLIFSYPSPSLVFSCPCSSTFGCLLVYGSPEFPVPCASCILLEINATFNFRRKKKKALAVEKVRHNISFILFSVWGYLNYQRWGKRIR